MSRLKLIDPAQATGKAQEAFNGPLKGKHFNIFKGLANSPAGLEFYLGMAGALSHAQLTPTEREAIQLALGQSRGCDYCVAAHTAIGKGAGLTDQQTIEARRGSMSDRRLDAVVKLALAIEEKKGHVSATDLANFKAAGFNDGNVVEVVAAHALATFTNYFNHVAETPIDFPAAPRI